MNRDEIFQAISSEREYQDSKWGTKFDDKNTINDWVTYIIQQAAKAAPLEYDEDKIKTALIKTASTCVAALQTLDRNITLAKRHYDK